MSSSLEALSDTYPCSTEFLEGMESDFETVKDEVNPPTNSELELACGVFYYYSIKHEWCIRPSQITQVFEERETLTPNRVSKEFYQVASVLPTSEITYPTAYTFAKSFATDLSVSPETELYIDIVWDEIEDELATTGNSPSCTGAAVLYVAGLLSGERIKQNTLATLSGRTETGIRNQYKNIINCLDVSISGDTTNWSEITFTIETIDSDVLTPEHIEKSLELLESYFEEQDDINETPLSLVSASLYCIDPSFSLESIEHITGVSESVTCQANQKIQEVIDEPEIVTPSF